MVEDIIESIRVGILAAVVLAVGLVVFVSVQTQVQDPTIFSEQLGTVNATADPGTNTFTLANTPLLNETVVFGVFNDSAEITTTCGANGDQAPCYNFTLSPASLTVNLTATSDQQDANISIDYRQDKQGFNTEARAAVDSIGDNSSSGFELGGVAILVIFAGIIIAALFISMVFRR